MTVTLPSTVPDGETTLTIQGASGSLLRNAFVTVRVRAASLTSTFTVPTGTQSLTALGTSDWAHWGLSTATSYSHKAAVTPLISNVTLVGGGSALRLHQQPGRFQLDRRNADGHRHEHDHRHLRRWGNRGFRLTVPADTTTRTLTLFVGVWQAQGGSWPS